MPRSVDAGIQGISLKEINVKLDPNVEYRWSVAVIPESAGDLKSSVATASIRFVPAPPTLQSRIASATDSTQAHIYADEGYWYDAVDVLVKHIRQGPNSKRARSHLASLLKQSGVRVQLSE